MNVSDIMLGMTVYDSHSVRRGPGKVEEHVYQPVAGGWKTSMAHRYRVIWETGPETIEKPADLRKTPNKRRIAGLDTERMAQDRKFRRYL